MTTQQKAGAQAGRDTEDLDDPTQPTPPKGVTKRGILSALGPGLITGASDDDPSGIATYSQVGSQFGYGLLWTMLFSYPLMAGIQEISAQIGRVTGRGIAGNLRRHYAPTWLYLMVGLVLVANVINLGADIGAMGAAVRLLVGGPYARLLFVLGIVGTGLPVLAGSAAYAVGEALRLPVGLNRDVAYARGFYAILGGATLIGLVLNFHVIHLDPIKALFWSAVINGVVAGPIMVLMLLMASSPRVMGEFTLNAHQKTLGWAATAVMLAAAVALFATWGK